MKSEEGSTKTRAPRQPSRLRRGLGFALIVAAMLIGTGGVLAGWIHQLAPLLLIPAVALAVFGANLLGVPGE